MEQSGLRAVACYIMWVEDHIKRLKSMELNFTLGTVSMTNVLQNRWSYRNSGGSRICQGGPWWARELNGGLGRSPQRGPEAQPVVGGQGAKPRRSWKLIVRFYTKKWPKVKDLSENLPRVWVAPPWRALSFGQWGSAARTAHSWIRHCTESKYRNA